MKIVSPGRRGRSPAAWSGTTRRARHRSSSLEPRVVSERITSQTPSRDRARTSTAALVSWPLCLKRRTRESFRRLRADLCFSWLVTDSPPLSVGSGGCPSTDPAKRPIHRRTATSLTMRRPSGSSRSINGGSLRRPCPTSRPTPRPPPPPTSPSPHLNRTRPSTTIRPLLRTCTNPHQTPSLVPPITLRPLSVMRFRRACSMTTPPGRHWSDPSRPRPESNTTDIGITGRRLP
jgi:hypothetical protein